MSSATIPYLPEEPQIETRTPQEQRWSGFMTFVECDLTGDYLDAGELAALTPAEMAGWNAAIAAKDEADFAAYLGNRNSFGDLTEY